MKKWAYAKNKKNMFDKQIYNYSKFRIIDKTKITFRIVQKLLNIINKFKRICLKKNYIRKIVQDIRKRKEQNEYDLIIFENGQNYIEYFRKKIKTNSKIVLHLHNDYLNKETIDGNKIIKSFDEIWTVSKFLKDRVNKICCEDKVKVLYNTIDFTCFEKKLSEKEKSQIMDKYNIKKDDYVYIYVGRIMEEKGTLELINAFKVLNELHNNIKLLVVGGNKSLENTGKYIDLVHRSADNNSNIIFTGQVKNTELYKFYEISNIQIIPSLWNEAFGLIALEGIASNLPIICTKVGGLPEILKEYAIYINKDNITKELINKMEYALINKMEINNMIKNYSSIKRQFSVEKYCEKFKILIDEIGKKE